MHTNEANMESTKDVRWKQRFQNFKQAFLFLEKAVNINTPSEIEEAGIIQAYEFTFELAWKTLKDYLEFNSVQVKFPRDVIKEAFRYELVDNGETWLDMLEKRNLMAHTYDQAIAQLAVDLIKNEYFPKLSKLYNALSEKNNG